MFSLRQSQEPRSVIDLPTEIWSCFTAAQQNTLRSCFQHQATREGTRVSLETGSADGSDSEQLGRMSSTPRSDEEQNMSVKTGHDGDARQQKPVQLRKELLHDKLSTVPAGAPRRIVVDKDVMGLQAPKVDADADAKGDKVADSWRNHSR